ncbi:MAG: endonuclease/exonuclease/phosphatase family protein [Candidatus Heimdallarchaeota archaeon]|nr:endonuclease/exonuclease/phosphatase family protein [Candidatus Heimdallarchaeota archaeon]
MNVKKIMKKSILILFIFILIITLGNLLHGFVSSGDAIDSNDERIRLLTFNIFEHPVDQVLQILKESDADIIALQEVDASSLDNIPVDAMQYFSEELGMYAFSHDYQHDLYGVSMLSRWPIVNTNILDMGRVDGYLNRGLIHATVDTPYGFLDVLATHLQQPFYPEDQIDQAHKIINYTQSQYAEHLVILGDFNMLDYFFNPPYYLLTREYHDAWTTSGNTVFSGSTWPSKSPYLRIDYIFVNDGIGVHKGSANTIGDETSSDHLGVMCDISLV